MTPKQRREYSELTIRVMRRLESRFVTAVKAALKSQLDDALTALKEDSLPAAINRISHVIVNDKLAAPIAAIYRFFGVYSGRRANRQINESAQVKPKETKAGFGFNEELLAEIIEYLRNNIISKAVLPITRTLREYILQQISEGETKGWGVDRIAREIEKHDYPLWMARRVVRTESLFAMQYGQKVAARKSRWETVSEWIAANDHRTRHSHRDVDGKKVDEGKRFRVPIYKKNLIVGYDLMIGPGDPTASAGNVINCRCSLVTVAKRDTKGRLVPKKVGNSRISVILPEQRFRPHTVITI